MTKADLPSAFAELPKEFELINLIACLREVQKLK
jgi:hypothetical protein